MKWGEEGRTCMRIETEREGGRQSLRVLGVGVGLCTVARVLHRAQSTPTSPTSPTSPRGPTSQPPTNRPRSRCHGPRPLCRTGDLSSPGEHHQPISAALHAADRNPPPPSAAVPGPVPLPALPHTSALPHPPAQSQTTDKIMYLSYQRPCARAVGVEPT